MKAKTLISVLATTVLGVSLALPTAASAHEVVRKKTVTVIRDVDRHDHYSRRDDERRSHYRTQRVHSRWTPPGHRKHYKKHKKHGHKHRHHRYDRYERREHRRDRDYRPVVRHESPRRHDNDGVRISIGYDVVL